MIILIIPFFELMYLALEVGLTSDGAVDMPVLISYVSVSFLIPPLIAWVYWKQVIATRKAFPEKLPKGYNLGKHSPKHSLSECCVELEYFIQACCCTCLYARLGDTFHTTGTGNFWLVQLACYMSHITGPIYLILEYLGLLGVEEQTLVLTWIGINIALSLWLACLRQRYRVRMGSAARRGFLADALLFLICTSCVAIQDARQVDEASLTRVECCCRLVETRTPGGPAVGEPVAVELRRSLAPWDETSRSQLTTTFFSDSGSPSFEVRRDGRSEVDLDPGKSEVQIITMAPESFVSLTALPVPAVMESSRLMSPRDMLDSNSEVILQTPTASAVRGQVSDWGFFPTSGGQSEKVGKNNFVESNKE